MANLEDVADDCRALLHKQSSRRADMIEGLLFAGDYEAIQDWLSQWKQEDSEEDSLNNTYQRTVSLMRQKRGSRRGILARLNNCINDEV